MWDFKKDPSLILDKILFIRWGDEQDSFWMKWGSLENVTLGYGGLVNGYSNMMEFPTIRRVGLNTGFNIGKYSGSVFIANVKDFSNGGSLIGMRGSYTISQNLPIKFGMNTVFDLNQFSGLRDKGEDDYPKEFNEIKASAMGYSFDIGYPIFNTELLKAEIYSEYNMLNFPAVNEGIYSRPDRSGSGITIPGIRANLFKFMNISLEVRINNGFYVPQYFDQAYDLNRAVIIEDGDSVTTKDMIIFSNAGSGLSTTGIYGSAGFNIFNVIKIDASYTSMKADLIEFNSFNAVLTLNTDHIPKFSEASAYYQHNNDQDPFKIESENTILGYRIGWEVSKGVSLIWDYRQFYRDNGQELEAVKQTSIETAFNF